MVRHCPDTYTLDTTESMVVAHALNLRTMPRDAYIHLQFFEGRDTVKYSPRYRGERVVFQVACSF